jgi:enamine deaminase RidA (YjgF/YER057c/UK114 family)
VALVGKTAYVAAQLPLDIHGHLVGRDNPEAQATQVFSNLALALRAVGADLCDVVKLTTYLKDLQHRPAVMEVRRRFFGDYRAPSTLVVVADLPVEGALLQVDAVAVLP